MKSRIIPTRLSTLNLSSPSRHGHHLSYSSNPHLSKPINNTATHSAIRNRSTLNTAAAHDIDRPQPSVDYVSRPTMLPVTRKNDLSSDNKSDTATSTVPVSSLLLSDALSNSACAVAKGDLVLVVRRGVPHLGVILSTSPCTSILATGFHLLHGPSQIWFRVPGAYLNPSTQTFTKPESEIQIDLREVMQVATKMHSRTRDRFMQAYESFVIQNKHCNVPLIQYIEWIFQSNQMQRLTVLHGLASILHIVSNQAQYLGSHTSLHLQHRVDFRPIRVNAILTAGRELIVAEAEQVGNSNQSVLNEFIEKCARVLKMNKGGGHDTRPPPKNESMSWTDKDRVLIDCIREVAFGTRESVSPFTFVGTHILSPLNYDPDIYKSENAVQLLIDLGVYHRLDNFNLYRCAHKIKINGLGFKDVDIKYAKAVEESVTINQTPRIIDGLDSMRYEFGRDHAIYTIDDDEAHEIDDGISIELSDTSQVDWVHVHIADPSAYIAQDSLIAQLALERGQSVYFPELSYPMIVGCLGAGLLSLSNHHKTHSSLPHPIHALTVSFQVLENGDISNAKVRPSILYAITSKTYNLVDTVLSWKVPGIAFEVGPDPLVLSSNPQNDMSFREFQNNATGQLKLSTNEIKDMKALQRVAVAHAKFRHEVGGAYNSTETTGQVRVLKKDKSPNFPSTEMLFGLPRVMDSRMDPEYEIKIHTDLLSRSPARRMVSELMVMAGRACAMFSAGNKIPMPYRHQPPPTKSEKQTNIKPIQERVHPVSLALSFRDSMEMISTSAPSHQSTKPGPHFQMGISGDPGYIKITSPIRRAVDLLGHYQLKSHFHPTGQVMLDDTLMSQMSALHTRERLIKSMQNKRALWWALEALQARVLANKHLTYIARVLRPMSRSPVQGLLPSAGGSYAYVVLVDAGVYAFAFLPTVTPTELQTGEFVQVVLSSVRPLAGMVACEITKRMVELDPGL